jgi:uncharacterized membrane protein
MVHVRESIEVDAPVEECYRVWNDFDNYPEFMGMVRDVRRISDVESLWVGRIMGMRHEWRAITTRREENRAISWRADGDIGMSGTVQFTSLGSRRTRIEADVEWHTGGIKEGVGSALGIDEATVKKDLHDFKEYIEGRKASRPGVVPGSVGGTGGGSRPVR